MQQVTGDLWDWHAAGAVVVITTGGAVNRRCQALMPRGCARQALERFPDLHRVLGGLLMQHGNHVFDLGRRLVSFPVEATPYEVADLELIERSCRELVELVDYKAWIEVVMPQPGCGGGGLSWTDVRPILTGYLDDRFKVIAHKIMLGAER